MRCINSRCDRRRGHNRIDVVHWGRGVYVVKESEWVEVIEELCLLEFAPDSAVHNQLEAGSQSRIESCGEIDRLLLAPVQRRIRLPRRFERIWKAVRQIRKASGQTLELTIACDSKITTEVCRVVAKRRVHVALAQDAVDTIAAGIDRITKSADRPGTAIHGGRCAAFPVLI